MKIFSGCSSVYHAQPNQSPDEVKRIFKVAREKSISCYMNFFFKLLDSVEKDCEIVWQLWMSGVRQTHSPRSPVPNGRLFGYLATFNACGR